MGPSSNSFSLGFGSKLFASSDHDCRWPSVTGSLKTITHVGHNFDNCDCNRKRNETVYYKQVNWFDYFWFHCLKCFIAILNEKYMPTGNNKMFLPGQRLPLFRTKPTDGQKIISFLILTPFSWRLQNLAIGNGFFEHKYCQWMRMKLKKRRIK